MVNEDLEIIGATVGSPHYIVAYLDVNTNNLYDADGNLYGNSTLATTLGNEFVLELHYVQDISTSDNPDNWTAWEGLSGMTVSSTLAFDDNYVHAVEATVAESTNAGSPTVKVNVPEISKDILSSSGNLIFNPFGIEPEDVSPNDTRPVKQIVPYSSFNYISGTVFEFVIEDAQGLPLNVVGGENATPVRVSDPLYLFVGTDTIYENNIPDRYGEGVFKFPMNINSRKLLKALDYSGAFGVSGTMEHNIYVKRNTIVGIKVGSYGVTCVRDSSQDVVATDSSDNKPYLFCCWTGSANDETVYTWWTKGNDINEDSYVYDVDATTKIANSLHGDDDISEIVYNTDSVLFRTFAFPFIVKNLVDYGNSLTIPIENTDWTKEYIISIVQNNSEILVGKASEGNYGTVLIGSNIDVDDGVISVKDASTSNKGVTQLVDSIEDTVSDDKAVTPNYVNAIIENDIATVEEVLTGATGTNLVDADNLRGALSVGQAVDVSCAPYNNSGSIVYVNGDFLQGFTATMINGTTVGFYDTTDHRFPKFADGLVYLFIANVSGSGTVTPNGASAVTLSGTPQRIWTKVTASNSGYISASANATMTVTNWRQYEVTALTDEAIAYIAQLEDPDAFFRSTSAYSIRDKYLIKQDMVCPFIPTINMPDNSDLTVAAGLSYKIKYTNDNTHTITADTIPSDGYGWDTHIQMFIKGTSAINFQAPLVLMNALTPNAGHNMVVKWRNGDALVYVDDTNVGYIVVKATGTGAGTLNDAISNDYTDYVIFSGDLAGTVIDAGDATFAGGTGFTAVNILGNGTEDTIITGNISTTSGKTINFQSLTIDGGTFGGAGTMNLDGVYINDFINNNTNLAIQRIDVSSNNNTVVITGGVITAQAGAQVIPYGETVPVAVEGTGNTLLNNGKLGYLVSVASGTVANTLYDALVGGGTAYSTIIFNPELDRQVISLSGEASLIKSVYLNGNGIENTNISGNFECGAFSLTVSNLNIFGGITTGNIIIKNSKIGSGFIISSGATLTFYNVNVLDSTVSGAGAIVFADGATVTSIIPSGSTIGTGSFSGLNITNTISTGNGLLENVEITGCTYSQVGVIAPSAGKEFTLKNCYLHGVLRSGSGRFILLHQGASRVNIIDSVITGNTSMTGAFACYAQDAGSVAYIKNSTIDEATSYSGLLVLDGVVNSTKLSYGDKLTSVNGINVVSGSTVTVLQFADAVSGATNKHIRVGTYDASGAWTTATTSDGQATVVINGHTIHVWGSGTYINTDGTTDLQHD